MAKRNTPSTTFKGDTSAYWGIGIISGIGVGLAYVFSSSIIWGITGLFALIGVYGVVYDRFRKVKFQNGELRVERGLGFNKGNFDLSKIDKITLANEREEQGKNILDFDFEEESAWKDYKYINVFHKGSEKPALSIYENDFDDEVFYDLIKSTQKHLLEHAGSPVLRASFALKQTDKYLREDKQLKQQLAQTLNEAYSSLYKPFKAMLSKDIIESLKAEKGILHQSIQQGNTLLYFKEGHYQEGISPEGQTFKTAQNLISTTEENLALVQNRIVAHEEVKAKLERILHRLDHQDRLNKVSEKLDGLQLANIQKDQGPEDMAFEAEVVEQLHQLSNQMKEIENLDKSQALREHIRMIKDS